MAVFTTSGTFPPSASPGWPGALICLCDPSTVFYCEVIISSVPIPSHSQKCSSLDNKLYGHLTYVSLILKPDSLFSIPSPPRTSSDFFVLIVGTRIYWPYLPPCHFSSIHYPSFFVNLFCLFHWYCCNPCPEVYNLRPSPHSPDLFWVIYFTHTGSTPPVASQSL